MPRQTRSTKQKELINLFVLDLGKLERTNRKTQKLAIADRVIRADAEGVLRDYDGQAYNESGQRLDDHGLILPEDTNEDQARLNAQLAARDTLLCRSTPYVTLFSETTQYDGVDRYPFSVDQHWIRTAPCDVQIPMQPESVYTLPVPYPRRRRSKQEIHAAKCTAIMEKILHTLPKDASETSSASHQAKTDKAQRVDIAEYIHTITPGQTTEKLPDLGPFTHLLGRRGGSSNPPPPLHPHPKLRQVRLLTQNKCLVGGNPLV
ncbi:hypothetical protein AXX17_ATUG01410 [Arabidopsis thaliana]|uniref:Uncharacterized protein n=1 Tax=Arabidopsis thaliana TaxID=3702 RepID=A0A178U811_ARATH|nr:hypothetical protein AXX17_ATUG01410 [Arabidopsis thaliana]